MKIRITPNPGESRPGYELQRVQTGQGTSTTNSDFASLNPASSLLHQIHFDHLYSTSGGNIVLDPAQKEGKFNSSGTTPKIYFKKYKNDNNLPSPISVQGKHSQTNKNGVTDSPKKTKQDDDGDMFSLDADSIQQVFQSMINLTSLTSMADPTAERADVPDTSSNVDNEHVKRDEQKPSDDKNKNKKINKVKIVDAIPSTSKAGALLRNEVQDKIENEPKVKTTNKICGDDIAAEKDESTKELASHNMSKTTATGKTTKSKSKLVKDKVHKTKSNKIGSNECKSLGNKEMMELNKELEHERELNMMLKYTTELMVRRWGEYLTMSTEQIRLFEIENALDFEMVQDVVDMLEDNERYVWELIDDLKFF